MKSQGSIQARTKKDQIKNLLRIKAPMKKFQKIAKVTEKTVRRLQKRRNSKEARAWEEDKAI